MIAVAGKGPEELARYAEERLGAKRAEELRVRFRNLPLSDGFMFGEVMRIASICKRFLELLLGVAIDHVEYLSKEKDISDSFTGHGIRVDVYLRDGKGTVYSIEMDTSGDGKEYRLRIRYYQGAIDRNNLEKGKDYAKLPDTFLIIISVKDFFGKGLALYRRKILIEGYQDTGDGGKSVADFPYDDGTSLYILNADYSIGNAPAEILAYLDCIRKGDTNPDHYDSQWMKEICHRIQEVRENPAEEAYYMGLDVMMMDERRKGREEGLEEGERKGRKEGRKEGREDGIVLSLRNLMANMGLTLDQAATALGIAANEREKYSGMFAAQ